MNARAPEVVASCSPVQRSRWLLSAATLTAALLTAALLTAALGMAATGCTATVALAPGSPEAAAANTTARVDRQYLPALEGSILDGNDRELIVERCYDGRAMTLSRESIRDIDHPGNVLATLGIALATIGTGVLITGVLFGGQSECVATAVSSRCSTLAPEGRAIGALGVGVLSAGVAMGIAGLVIWMDSKSAAEGDD